MHLNIIEKIIFFNIIVTIITMIIRRIDDNIFLNKSNIYER